MAVNAQGSGSDALGIRTIINMVEDCCPQWAVLFLSESDFLESTDDSVDISPHLTWRHWPGHGSRALRWVLRSNVKHLLFSVDWCGRSGSLTLGSRFGNNRQFLNFVGLHGAHGDDLCESLSDLSTLCSALKPCSKFLVLGDWNIDLLPSLANDPFCCMPSRLTHHSDRRGMLQSWLDAHHVDLVVPEKVLGCPGGRWNDACKSSVVSGIPSDDQLGVPSLLDFGAASRNLVQSSWLAWEPRFSDHAASFFVLRFDVRKPRFVKSTWRCRDPTACSSWLRTVMTESLSSDGVSDVFDICHSLKTAWADKTSCAQRRAERMPFQLRSIYAELRVCTSSAQCSSLRKQAFLLRHERISDQRSAVSVAHVVKGGVLSKTRKLHKLRAVDSFQDDDNMCSLACRTFAEKWGCRNLALIERLRDFVHSSEGMTCQIDILTVSNAFFRLRKHSVLDKQSVCVSMLKLLFDTDPVLFTAWVSKCLASTPTMCRLQAFCNVYGKKTSHSASTDLRAIIPMSSVLRLFDRILALITEPTLDQLLPIVPGIFVGGRKHTQTLDIGHSAALLMEKGMDMGSRACIAQADIRSYFDSLPLFLIVRWLVDRGVNRALLSAIIRAQLFTVVVVCVGQAHESLPVRAIGGLTGSTMALLLARVPIEGSLLELADSLKPHGFPLDNVTLLASSWVDNIYTVAPSPSSATTALELILQHLRGVWHLSCKDGSKEVMSCKSCPDQVVVGVGWQSVEDCYILGYCTQSDGGVRRAWTVVKQRIQRALFANIRAPGFKRLCARSKVAMLGRVLSPIFLYGAQTWPPSHALCVDVNSFQRKIIGISLGLRKTVHEDPAAFVRRRGRMASRLIEDTDTWWTRRWLKRILKWNDHLTRDYERQMLHFVDKVPVDLIASQFSWAPMLSHWRAREFLSARRDFFVQIAPQIRVSSRTGLRAGRGKVHTRWHEGLDFARRSLDESAC